MLLAISGNFFRQIIVGLSQLGLMVLITRLHGTEGVGIYTLAVLPPILGAQILTFGLQSASIYLGARGRFPLGLIVRANLLMALAISMLFMIVSVPLVMRLGESIFSGVTTNILLLGLTAFPASFGITTLPSLAQATNAFRVYNCFLLVQPLVQFAIALTIILTGGTIEALVASYVISSWVAFIVMVVWLTRHWGLGKGPIWPFFQAAISYGLFSHLSNIVTLINYRAVVWLSANILGLSASGSYVLAMQLAEKLWLPSQAAATVILPQLTREYINKFRDHSIELTSQAARATLLVTTLLALGAGLLADELMTIFFGMESRHATAPFVILLTGIVAWAPSRILAADISARGAVKLNFWNSIITLSINLILLLLLMPIYKIEGAALATTIAFTGDLVLRSAFYSRLSGTVIFSWILPKQNDFEKLCLIFFRKNRN